MATNNKFDGFSPGTLAFLKNIKANNNKAWFETHKSECQQVLLDPLHDLAADLSGGMLAIDPLLVVGARAVSRIYRDTRFTAIKDPYKSNMWITFKRPSKDWIDAPAYFFEITPDDYRYGMGFYSASADTMRKFRKAIDETPQEFLEAVSFFSKEKIFVLEGDKYKKILDAAKPAEIQDWYQRKNFYLVCNREIDACLFSRRLVDELLAGFDLIAPFYHYLLKLKEREN